MRQERSRRQNTAAQQYCDHVVPAESVAQISEERADGKAEQPHDLKADIPVRLGPRLEAPDRVDDERERGCREVGNRVRYQLACAEKLGQDCDDGEVQGGIEDTDDGKPDELNGDMQVGEDF